MTAPRRLRIDLAYDGTEFAGWQVQPGARTVQGTLEEALGKLHGGRPLRARGAVRTDAGVHARRQVADCDLETALDDAGVLHALARMLPADVRPLDVRTVEPGWSARFAAAGKTYVYRLDRTPRGDPFRARYALHRPGPLDVAAIEDALARLPGRRDWSGFAAAGCTVENRVRALDVARWVEDPLPPDPDAEARLVFRAEGFLQHMVRNLAGTLLEIGRGRFGPDRVDRVLETGDRRLAGPTAPAHGLTLWRVHYNAAEEEPAVG